MSTVTTRPTASSTLYVAFELGNAEWRLAMTSSIDRPARVRPIPARDLDALQQELTAAKRHFALGDASPTVSCYEAGRDGFWLHHYLLAHGIQNRIVDSSSIEVNRRQRRQKTDRLDAVKLVTMLIREVGGEPRVWSVVRPPSDADEDRRQVHRELLFTRRDRARHTNRIKGLLASQGILLTEIRALPGLLPRVRRWDGSRLPPRLTARLEREWEARCAADARIQRLIRERRTLLTATDDPAIAQVHLLHRLHGIGLDGAWLYVMEFFAWREFRNRRQVGGLAGLGDTHYQSGDLAHQQGISKAGNRWIRALAINSAWGWLRYQPESALTKWYHEKYARGTSRQRKIGIVALARKLLIALWRYLDQGIVPEGARLRA